MSTALHLEAHGFEAFLAGASPLTQSILNSNFLVTTLVAGFSKVRMASQTNGVNGHHRGTDADYDTIVVGAGFAGLRIIVELRKLGLSFKVLEEGAGVGGTW